jgi:hypothetical protein
METHSYRRDTYGKIKQAVIEGHAAGLTYADLEAKYGFLRKSLHHAAWCLGLKLKYSKRRKPCLN